MGYFNDASLTSDTRPFSDEGWASRSEPLPDGLRIAHYSESGWSYRTPTHRLWVTDAPACERCGGNHPVAACRRCSECNGEGRVPCWNGCGDQAGGWADTCQDCKGAGKL